METITHKIRGLGAATARITRSSKRESPIDFEAQHEDSPRMGSGAPPGTRVGTVKIPVIPGETLTLSGYIDATNVLSGSPQWAIMDPTLATTYCAAPQTAGVAGVVNASFTVPDGVTRVVLIGDANGCVVAMGLPLIMSSPQIEEGDEPTEYNENLNDELNSEGGSVMLDPISLAATITNKNDLKLTWQYPDTLPLDFHHFAVYVGPVLESATLVHYTKKFELLITDPTPGTNTYWVAVFNDAGAIDADPPSISATVPELADVTSLAATVTTHNDLLLTWDKPSTLPTGFDCYEIRSGGCGIATATESGTTATVTTDAAHGYSVGESVNVYGVSVGGYNGNGLVVLSVPTSTTFTYTASSGLGAGTGGSTIGWATATFVDRTKKANYLIVDPPNTNLAYMIGVLDKAGNYDATPPSVGAYFTQQEYTVKTLLGADVGPFNSGTTIIGPFNFVVPPSGGKIHVDWTMIFTNGSTAQALRGIVQDNTTPLNCAQHRTHMDAGSTGGLNASGHFSRRYPGGATISLSLVAIPVGGNNVTINASDEEGSGTGDASVTYLDIQFHPSPN